MDLMVGQSHDELCHEIQVTLSTTTFVPLLDRLDEAFQAENECGNVDRLAFRGVALHDGHLAPPQAPFAHTPNIPQQFRFES